MSDVQRVIGPTGVAGAMRIALFGTTGMVGRGALLEALDDPDVEEVVAVTRQATGVTHPKLAEVQHEDFTDFTSLVPRLAACDACFFAIGVTSAGKTEAEYTKVTYDIALAAGRAMAAARPGAVFVFVSGAGTDATGKGRVMWARVKGKAENALAALPLAAYMFRPGFIRPLRGVRSRTAAYRVLYALTSPLGWLLARAAPGVATDTVRLGRAMLAVARTKPAKRVFETGDINALVPRAG